MIKLAVIIVLFNLIWYFIEHSFLSEFINKPIEGKSKFVPVPLHEVALR
jgi:hypothetical protein